MRDEFAGANILLVEDDPDIRELLATLLQLAGFTPTVCSNAEFGLEQLREAAFDLVLTDYALPNRTGGWLIQQAKAEGLLDATPVLVVTAHPNPADVDGYEVICKPFDLDHLVSRVNLTIYDLSQNPEAGKADAVTFTPTLVKRSPGPRTFILGHITNPDLLVELLQACGEDAGG